MRDEERGAAKDSWAEGRTFISASECWKADKREAGLDLGFGDFRFMPVSLLDARLRDIVTPSMLHHHTPTILPCTAVLDRELCCTST